MELWSNPVSTKHILIVDDEESILTVLKGSLKKLGTDYQVVTAHDGFAALDRLKEQKFDLVISDYRMTEMDGLELLEAVRYLQPKARVIMMTAYHNSALATEVRKLQAYHYLTKPLKISEFRRVVQEALGVSMTGQQGILVLSDERCRRFNHILEKLRVDVSARCVFLTDAEGRTISQTGDTEKIRLEQVASLLGGGIATLLEAGRMIDNDADAINLAYREGKQDYLYAINIGQHLLMILIIDRTQYSSRLGAVWHYVQQVALTLRHELEQAEYANPQQVFQEGVDQAFNAEIDKLFQ
jgi:CheY-like chemotaxis protein